MGEYQRDGRAIHAWRLRLSRRRARSWKTPDRDRRFNQLRLGRLRIVRKESRAGGPGLARGPSAGDPSDADGENGETAVGRDLEPQKVFPVFYFERGEGLIGMAAEEIERNQEIHAEQERADEIAPDKDEGPLQDLLRFV